MRVLFNGMVLGGKKTGIGHYASELIRCLGPLLGGDFAVHVGTQLGFDVFLIGDHLKKLSEVDSPGGRRYPAGTLY